VSALLGHLATGDAFLGLPTRKTRALLLTEESELTIREKAERFGLPPFLEVLCLGQVAGRPWAEVARLAASHAHACGAELVVIDTFTAFSGFREDQENQAGAVLQAIEPLRVAASNGLAVLVVVHERKSGGSHGEAIRGSGAMLGEVDIAISVDRSDLGPNVRSLDTISRFFATPSRLLIELDETGRGYRVRGEAATARAQCDNETIVSALARLGGEADIVTLAAETSIPDRTLRRRLQALEGVESCGAGKRGAPERFRLIPSEELAEAA
jgi:hypothetical protein